AVSYRAIHSRNDGDDRVCAWRKRCECYRAVVAGPTADAASSRVTRLESRVRRQHICHRDRGSSTWPGVVHYDGLSNIGTSFHWIRSDTDEDRKIGALPT